MTGGVVAIPVNARLIYVARRPLDVGQRRVAARAVDDEWQQVDTLGHSVDVRHATDEVPTALTIERR